MADRKEYKKQYYLNNVEKIKEQQKQYKLNNVEKIAEYKKEHIKEYRQTENCKKTKRINNWKRSGVISENFDELYNKYINTTNCDNCDIELIYGIYGNNKKCLDHCHKTGQFRNVLCCGCNNRRK